MVKESKELLPVFLDSPLERSAGLCRTMKRHHVGEKPFNRPFMFSKMAFFQSIPVNSFDDLSKQRTKSFGYKRQLIVERVLKNVVIDVAHQVDQTFLLGAVNGVIR